MKTIDMKHFIVSMIFLIFVLSFISPSYGQLFDDRDAAPLLPEIESFEKEGIVSRDEFETIDGLIKEIELTNLSPDDVQTVEERLLFCRCVVPRSDAEE